MDYIKAGEWLGYTVNVAQDGAYNFGFRVASASNGGTFHVELVNASNVTSNVTGPVTVPNTKAWTTWQTVNVNNVNLTAGQYFMRIVFDSAPSGYVGNLNNVVIAPVPAAPPPPVATVISDTAATKLEVENFDNGAEGSAYHDVEAQNLGGFAYRTGGVDIAQAFDNGEAGLYVGWTKPGEWLKYTINVTKAGNYDILSRVAASGAGGTFHIELDSPSTNLTGAVTIPDTGGWTNWEDVIKGSVALPAGQHTLRVSMDSAPGGYVGNMDYFQISPAVTPPKVLVFSRTVGFRHDSIAAGIAAIQQLGQQDNIVVDATENDALFTAGILRSTRRLCF